MDKNDVDKEVVDKNDVCFNLDCKRSSLATPVLMSYLQLHVKCDVVESFVCCSVTDTRCYDGSW